MDCVCQGHFLHIERFDDGILDVFAMCARYGTWGKTVPDLCEFCPFFGLNQGHVIK